MTLDELVQASVNQEKERRRYALLQAAVVIWCRPEGGLSPDEAIDTAGAFLCEIEEKESK